MTNSDPVATTTFIVSSALGDSPEELYYMDLLSGFRYGAHGDIELYDDDSLVVKQALEEQIVHINLYG